MPVRVVDIGSVICGEFAENACRKDFTPSELVAIGEAVEFIERRAAQLRQERTQFGSGGSEEPAQTCDVSELDDGGGKLPPPCKSRDVVANQLGISGKTYEKARAVVAAAEEDPSLAPLVIEMDRTGKVNGVYKKLRTTQAATAIRSEPPPLPDGPFRVIVADPPWQYENRPDDPSHRSALPYPTMTEVELCELPVAGLAADDSILWLWTTNAHMREAYAVLDAWGFNAKTILTWVKDRFGTGDWLRGQTEHCLMAVRGKPLVTLRGQSTVLHAPLRAHSQKPDGFYDLVESLCPGSKCELFARQKRPGWISWGNECEPVGACS